jgi:general secretion pathway protein B
MSYILDALRRAEAERDRGSLPGLNTHAGVPVYVDRRLLGRGNPWLWLLAGMVGAVLLVMGVRLWWGWATADVVPSPDVVTQAPAGATAAVPQPAPSAPPAVLDRVADAAPRAAAAAASARVRAAAAAASASTAAPAASAAGGPPSSPPTAQPNAAPVAQPDGRIHVPADLPTEIARELPNLVFGGLIQLEDPPRRSLIINGVIYMEGDLIQPDLVLEQIRLNAAVLRYKGHRYQLPI